MTNGEINDIKYHAIEMIKNYDCDENLWKPNFDKYSPCYKFSNEYINQYMNLFNINDKNVLTICGSGDQVLFSILKGAKNIDIFDSNLLTYFNMWLKIYAIKYLSTEEFTSLYARFNFNRKKIIRQNA